MNEDLPTSARPGLTLVDVLSALVVAAMAVGAALAWLNLPEGRYPVHMGLSGEVDRWAGKGEFITGLVTLTAVNALVAGLMAWFVRNPTMGRQVERAGPVFAVGRVVAVFGIAFGAAILLALGFGLIRPGENQTMTIRLIMAFVSLVILAVGEPLGKARPNALAGVRTYFTLTSRLAWDKANRLAGRLFFWIGLAGLAAAPFAPQPYAVLGLAAAIVVSIIWTFIEAWRVWKSDPERRDAI